MKNESEIITRDGGALPAWVQKMRSAAQAAITEQDIREIVAKQVERAKQGDEKAMKFVFDQVLGGAAMKGATFVQNNYAVEEPAAAKTPTTIEDRAVGLMCGQCGYEPEIPDRNKSCPKCNAHRWEHKAGRRLKLSEVDR